MRANFQRSIGWGFENSVRPKVPIITRKGETNGMIRVQIKSLVSETPLANLKTSTLNYTQEAHWTALPVTIFVT